MVHRSAAMKATYDARFAASGNIESLAAAGEVATANYTRIADQEEGGLANLEASAVKSFSRTTDKMRYVRAKMGFTVFGQYVGPGDIVELKEGEANLQVSLDRADFVTDADVAAAQKAK